MADENHEEKTSTKDVSDKTRKQGNEPEDGNGAGFTGQGGQKESNSKKGEGTGYTNG